MSGGKCAVEEVTWVSQDVGCWCKEKVTRLMSLLVVALAWIRSGGREHVKVSGAG